MRSWYSNFCIREHLRIFSRFTQCRVHCLQPGLPYVGISIIEHFLPSCRTHHLHGYEDDSTDRSEVCNSGLKKKGFGVHILPRQNKDVRERSNGENEDPDKLVWKWQAKENRVKIGNIFLYFADRGMPTSQGWVSQSQFEWSLESEITTRAGHCELRQQGWERELWPLQQGCAGSLSVQAPAWSTRE